MSALHLQGSGRARSWVGYLGAVGLGAGAVALAAVWTSGPWAAGIGAAVTTLSGLAAERMRPPEEGADAQGAGEVLRTARGRIPLLRHVDRPELAGAHPAEAPATPPAYIERDAEPRLHAALEEARFVLVVGESTAGKTRLAYEVARARYPRHAFVRPLSRTALPEAVRISSRRRRAVLWLDDLEDHLGAGGLTAVQLASLRTTMVIATMRVQEYRRYDAREESRLTGSDRDAWRAQRDLLQQAAVIRLPRHWSPDERRRAAAHRGDPRIGAALRAGERFGVAEVLAAGPELLASWENAWAPGANPRGAAVVTAAVDCRRAGLRRPVSRAWLRELHAPYLAARGGGDLQPEPFAEAMDWACAAAYATSGLLIGNYGAGYTAFDYLLNAPGHGPVPDHLWRGLLARVEPADAYDMGLVAHQDGRLARAVEALGLALRGGVPGAELPLTIAIGDSGKPRRAAADLAGIARRRTDRLGPRHPDTLAARHQLAFFVGESGDHLAAAARFAELLTDAGEVLGPDHPDTLAARHQLAYFTGEGGDPRMAARQLEALLADRLRVHGPGHPQVLATRRSLIWFRSGDPVDAERELAELLTEAEAADGVGPDDPHTLAIRGSLAALAARAGRTAEAADAWAALTADRTRVLGEDHPHVFYSRLEWARALLARGRTGEARALLTGASQRARSVLEPGHRHLRTARELLAGIGDPARAADPADPARLAGPAGREDA
ncbi:tetratricopeptide repeat protein [Streptomyces sp. ISL-66]|uniref:tetratricopeptide repeat protein n=1 Tax=Streptomyces sp. ISL-66 TaxID=2819186 RepID=UPI001BE60B79|nr:tetratricopeptide repeat protein [Streptomyces sp. ISL-66]MBT2468275.1 tetratricopeptide repeat protein [Streptomyces sp. ISL-66]